MLGAQLDYEYRAASTAVVPGSMLYLFSDGVFEVETADGAQRQLDDFLPLLLPSPIDTVSEPERLVGEMRRLSGRVGFEDDLTVLVVTFP